MAQEYPIPPAKLANARTVEYAVLGDNPDYFGDGSIFVDGEEFGPAPCLAICQELQGSRFILLHCDRDWNVLSVSTHPTVKDAEKHANKIYPGVTEKWTTRSEGSTQTEEASETEAADIRCAICGREPEEVTAMIEAGKVRICDGCIRELYQMLKEKD